MREISQAGTERVCEQFGAVNKRVARSNGGALAEGSDLLQWPEVTQICLGVEQWQATSRTSISHLAEACLAA